MRYILNLRTPRTEREARNGRRVYDRENEDRNERDFTL
jgi:hypothetical protein